MFGLLQWHFLVAPRWLLVLTWNVERAAARYFSAGTMLRTLVSHWHKDVVSYQQGTLGRLVLAFAWNMISRGIGLVVRTAVLAVYAVVAAAAVAAGVAATAIFLLWPAAAVAVFFASLQLLLYGAY